jgi:hypothetical protein
MVLMMKKELKSFPRKITRKVNHGDKTGSFSDLKHNAPTGTGQFSVYSLG